MQALTIHVSSKNGSMSRTSVTRVLATVLPTGRRAVKSAGRILPIGAIPAKLVAFSVQTIFLLPKV